MGRATRRSAQSWARVLAATMHPVLMSMSHAMELILVQDMRGLALRPQKYDGPGAKIALMLPDG